ncbi:conserved hypothetical protein, partial [Ricinus communis]
RAIFQPGGAAACLQVGQQHRVAGIAAEVDALHLVIQAGADGAAARVLGVEHHGAGCGLRHHALDRRQVFQRLHAVQAQVVLAHVQQHRHVAAVERQAALEDAAARRLQHRELHLWRRQHGARRPVAAAIAALDLGAVDEHPFAGGAAGGDARLAQRMFDHQRGGGLAVGAGDRDHRDAAVVVAEHGLDDGRAGVARHAGARIFVHADAGCRVDFDDRAIAAVQRTRNVLAHQVDAGDIQPDLAGCAHAHGERFRRQAVGHILRRAAAGQVGVAAHDDAAAGLRHAVEVQPLRGQRGLGVTIQRDAGQDVGVAFAACRITVFQLHQLAHGGFTVADDRRRAAQRGGHHALAGHQDAVVVAGDVALDDDGAAMFARALKSQFHFVRGAAAGRDAAPVVAVQWLDRHQAVNVAGGAQRLLQRAHADTFRHRYAGFLQQRLGQLLVRRDADRDMASVAGDGGLQPFLLRAPAEQEHVGVVGQALVWNALADGGAQDGAGAGADGVALGGVLQRGHAGLQLLRQSRRAGGQAAYQRHRQVAGVDCH